MNDDDILRETQDWLTEILLGVAMVAVREQYGGELDWRLCLGHATGWKLGFMEGALYGLRLRAVDAAVIESLFRDKSRDA
jgi:hypothetical protein